MSGASRRPLIGLTLGQDNPEGGEYFRIRQAYTRAVTAAGGVPVPVVPLEDETALRQLVSMLDGVVFTGGADVYPSRYGVDYVDPTTRVDAMMDALELRVAGWTVRGAVPTLGICRGQQLLNVALGGGLVQDLPSTGVRHRQEGPRSAPSHPIRLAEGSRLAEIVGATTVEVNSFHHQAVEEGRLGRGLRAVAWSPDGVIEAVESVEHPWLLAVQFHPEELIGVHEPSRRLFGAFVEACRRRIARGGAVE